MNAPRSIVWKPGYNTGNLMVDRQHRDLIDLVNLLLLADHNKEGAFILNDAFDALRRYVTQHFSEEEDLLEAVESPHLEWQRDHHQALTRELNNLWGTERDVPEKRVIHELAQWAEFRLLKHFLTIDSKTFQDEPFVELGDLEA